MRTMKLLIAEDNPSVRKFIREILSPVYSDCELLEAENGKEAVETFRKQNPEVILMDIMMDVLDGLSALKQIRELSRNVAIIIITQLPESEYRNESIALGANDFLSKENLFSLPFVIENIRLSGKSQSLYFS